MNKTSKTDWKRLAEMDDKDFNTSDIPELDGALLSQATLSNRSKQTVTIRLGPKVLASVEHSIEDC